MRTLALCVLSVIVGAIVGGGILIKFIVKPTFDELARTRQMSSKHLDLYKLMNSWVNVKLKGKKVSEYLESYGYRKIAIYGMNYVGVTLFNELSESKIEIVAGIDKNLDNIDQDIKVCKPNEFTEEVDAIVVTPISYFDEICEGLEKQVSCPIISIEDIIYELS